VFGWIEPFYEETDAAIEPGHIWCDQPIYMPPRHALRIERVDPEDDRKLNFRVGGRTADTFDHAPVHSLRLKSSEAAVLAKSKKDRPVIVLGGASATELRPGPRQTLADAVMVVPIYGADQYDAHIRERISYYEFTNAFYLPAHGPAFDEGFGRLDHVQAVAQTSLYRHKGLKLSPDALDALIVTQGANPRTGMDIVSRNADLAERKAAALEMGGRVIGPAGFTFQHESASEEYVIAPAGASRGRSQIAVPRKPKSVTIRSHVEIAKARRAKVRGERRTDTSARARWAANPGQSVTRYSHIEIAKA
jgi:hypothetical protein